MPETLSLVLKSACIGGAALIVLILSSCSSAMAQKYAEQYGKQSSAKSYLSGKSQYKGNTYAQGAQSQGSSYASSVGAAGGTSYAQSAQTRTPSYVSSGSSGTSYARGTSYANSSKAVPYSQQIRFGNSGGSLLGIMHGAPAARTQSSYSASSHRKSAASVRSAPVANAKADPVGSTAKQSSPGAGPAWSNKLRKSYSN